MRIWSNAVSISFSRPSGRNRYEKQKPLYPSMWAERRWPVEFQPWGRVRSICYTRVVVQGLVCSPKILAQELKESSCLLLGSKYLGKILFKKNKQTKKTFPIFLNNCGTGKLVLQIPTSQEGSSKKGRLGESHCTVEVKQMKFFNLFKINCTTFSPKLFYWWRCQNQGDIHSCRSSSKSNFTDPDVAVSRQTHVYSDCRSRFLDLMDTLEGLS